MSTKYGPGIDRDEVTGEWKLRPSAKAPSGQIKSPKATLPASTSLKDVHLYVEEMKEAVRTGGRSHLQRGLTVMQYAVSWLARRKKKTLRSLTTQDRYERALTDHILPDLGTYELRSLDKVALEEWLVKDRDRNELVNQLPGRPQRPPEPYAAATVNSWWRVLKSMLQEAVLDLGLDRDPTLHVKPLPDDVDPDELGDETINTLTADEVVRLLIACKREYPQWFAFVFLGFSIGARPGELRPIRWDKDLDATTGKLVIRRSQHNKHMGPTKTKKARSFVLPDEVLTVLKEHRIWLQRNGHPFADGELVFPRSGRHWRARRVSKYSRSTAQDTGAPQCWSASALDKPLDRMAVLAGISRKISQRVFRRTLNDIARRDLELNNVVIREYTGHSSIEMQETYSTVDLEEKRQGLAKVIELFKTKGQVEGQVAGLFGAIPDLPRKRKQRANG